MLNRDGPITFGILLEAFPKVNGAAGRKASVLNHLSIVGCSSLGDTPGTTSGRPLNVMVGPLWTVVIAFICHPAITYCFHPWECCANGRSQVALKTIRCGVSSSALERLYRK